MELGIVWPPTWLELDRVGLNWIKLKFSPNSSDVFHRLAASANSSQLSPSCFVIVLWPRGRIQTIEWFLASWLDLVVRLATHPCKFWFCNLARVGLGVPFCQGFKAGLYVRRKHKHKHKPRVNRDDASTSTSARSFFLRLCLRRPCSHVAYACACVVPVHTWLMLVLASYV